MRHTFDFCVNTQAFQMELNDLRRAYFNFARAPGSLVAAPYTLSDMNKSGFELAFFMYACNQ